MATKPSSKTTSHMNVRVFGLQFVEFNVFDVQAAAESVRSLACFATEVLKEVPDQVVSYMMKNDIKPPVTSRRSTMT